MPYAYQTQTSQSELFFAQAAIFADDVFMKAKMKNGLPASDWVGITWAEAAETARQAGAGLIRKGIDPKMRVAVFAHNQPRWILADQAIQGAGAIGVPIYPTSTDQQLAFILNDCGAKALFTGDAQLLDQALRVRSDVESLDFIISMCPLPASRDDAVLDFDALCRIGADSTDALETFEQRRKNPSPSDIAAIIYTSGTTGNPKGVMLSHANFKAQTDMLVSTPILQKILERNIRLNSLCFLPLCHVMGRTNDYHLQMAIGTTLYFAESIQKVQENLLEVKPQVLFSVPRLYEKIYDGVQRYGETLSGRPKKIFDWALEIGDTAADHMISGTPMPSALGMKFALANALVFDKIRKVVGFDRLVVAGSGGGALQRDICKFFRSMNITITEGYGLSETTSAVSSNAPVFVEPLPDKWIYHKALDWLIDVLILTQGSGKCPYKSMKGIVKAKIVSQKILPHFIIKPGFVGRPCKDTEIRIAEDGEILVKGPQVFSRDAGYYNQPEKTADVFTDDGFFKTGDIGYFDADGFLKITDRKKELIVTSGGKNIAPLSVEMALIHEPYIDQCCVIGDGRKYISALIVPEFDLLARYARRNGIDFQNTEDLLQSAKVKDLFDTLVANANRTLARYEQVKRYHLLAHPFSETSGELTPTLKMKRKVIHEKYDTAIASMYDE